MICRLCGQEIPIARLICKDCGSSFEVDAIEQQRLIVRGWAMPRACPGCREANRQLSKATGVSPGAVAAIRRQLIREAVLKSGRRSRGGR